jgi:hypothetical protein
MAVGWKSSNLRKSQGSSFQEHTERGGYMKTAFTLIKASPARGMNEEYLPENVTSNKKPGT